MALVRASVLYKIFPAEYVHEQEVKLRPNEHHYENEGEEPYIKYGCQICEQIADKVKDFVVFDEERKFARFSLPKGIERCPCCGINIDWDYK